jgi:hypothetical protein
MKPYSKTTLIIALQATLSLGSVCMAQVHVTQGSPFYITTLPGYSYSDSSALGITPDGSAAFGFDISGTSIEALAWYLFPYDTVNVAPSTPNPAGSLKSKFYCGGFGDTQVGNFHVNNYVFGGTYNNGFDSANFWDTSVVSGGQIGSTQLSSTLGGIVYGVGFGAGGLIFGAQAKSTIDAGLLPAVWDRATGTFNNLNAASPYSGHPTDYGVARCVTVTGGSTYIVGGMFTSSSANSVLQKGSACYWTGSGGFWSRTTLPTLTGATGFSEVTAVSPNGLWMTGFDTIPATSCQIAFIYDVAGNHIYSISSDSTASSSGTQGSSVSDNGVVVGIDTSSTSGNTTDTAFLWSVVTGQISMSAPFSTTTFSGLLPYYSAALPTNVTSLKDATGISEDGTRVVGTCVLSTSHTQGYWLTLPPVASLSLASNTVIYPASGFYYLAATIQLPVAPASLSQTYTLGQVGGSSWTFVDSTLTTTITTVTVPAGYNTATFYIKVGGGTAPTSPQYNTVTATLNQTNVMGTVAPSAPVTILPTSAKQPGIH